MSFKRLKQTLFGREQIVGLDLHEGWISAAWFAADKPIDAPQRVAIGQYDRSGSDTQIAQALREFWTNHRFPTRTVQTCLHSRNLLVRYFEYENLDPSELPHVLELEAEEALQRPSGEIALDWTVRPTRVPERSKLSGILSAAPRQRVQRHLKLIQSAGLYSVGVSTSNAAITQLYSWLSTPQKKTAPVCLVNLSERSVDIIMHAQNSNYPRTFFSAPNGWSNNINYLQENIQNSLLYYHLKLKQPPIEQILVLGALDDLDSFCAALSEQTALPVEPLALHADERLAVATAHSDHPACNVATAIGLGLREDLR